MVSYTANGGHSLAPTPIQKYRVLSYKNEDSINYSSHGNSMQRIPKSNNGLAPISNYGNHLFDNSIVSNSYFLNLPSIYSVEQELQILNNTDNNETKIVNPQLHRKTPSFPGNLQGTTQINRCEFKKIFNPKIKCTFPKINKINSHYYEQRECCTERGSKPMIHSKPDTSNPFVISEDIVDKMKQTGCFDAKEAIRLSAPPSKNSLESYLNATFKPMKSKKIKTIDRIKIQEHQMSNLPICLRSSEPLAKGKRKRLRQHYQKIKLRLLKKI